MTNGAWPRAACSDTVAPRFAGVKPRRGRLDADSVAAPWAPVVRPMRSRAARAATWRLVTAIRYKVEATNSSSNFIDSQPPIIFLLYGAYQRAGQLVSLALAGTGIAPEDAPIYNVLERRERVTPTQLGEALGMAPSTVTYRTKGLAERGHLERVDNPDDGRSTLLALTPAGERAWREVLPGFLAALRAAEGRLAIPQVEAGRALTALYRRARERARRAAASAAASRARCPASHLRTHPAGIP